MMRFFLLTAALVGCSNVRAFSSPAHWATKPKTKQSCAPATRRSRAELLFLPFQHKHPPRSLTPLFYRELSEDDNETTMLQTQTRTPPGFKMRQALARQQMQRTPPKNAMNQMLLRALKLNQYLILALATASTAAFLFATQGGMDAFSHLNELLRWTGEGPSIFDLTVTPERLAWGVGGALPMLGLSNLIENSDKRVFANINFSTIVMTMTLFGRRSLPPPEFIPPKFRGMKIPTTKTTEVLLQSFSMSFITGFCEETVFRRLVPSGLALQFGGGVFLPLIGQAVLFGLGHISPMGLVEENVIVGGLQVINGLAFGLIYLLSGGDLVPCIIAHTLYDFVTFFKTWSDANAQVEYANAMVDQPLPAAVEQEVRRLLGSRRMDPDLFRRMKHVFFTFDFDKNQTLTLSEVRKGIAYSYLAVAKGTPPPESEIDRVFNETIRARKDGDTTPRLNFADFLRLYSAFQSGNVDTSGKKRLVAA
jgi:membrane protease YdiL (CAAX protease family)